MPPDERPWITPEEAAQREGVSARTVRRWASDGRIPATLTRGGRWRILTPPPTTTEGQQP